MKHIIDWENYGSPAFYYTNFYSKIPCGTNQSFQHNLVHKLLERGLIYKNFDEVLEVGAGQLEHIPFITHDCTRYIATDIAYTSTSAPPENSHTKFKLTTEYQDAQKLTYPDSKFDRMIATCVLLHLPSPEIALHEWRRVTKNNGQISIYVPNNDSPLTRVLRNITSKRVANKLGFQGFDLLIAREHINSSWGLEQLVNFVFRNDEIRTLAIPFKSPFFLRLFTIYQIQVKK